MGGKYSILINSVLGAPEKSNQKKTDLTLFLDRLNIAAEEWFKSTCKLKTKHSDNEIPKYTQYNLLDCLTGPLSSRKN